MVPGGAEPVACRSRGTGSAAGGNLEDGRVIERSARARVTKSAPLRPGEPVLIWYDPRDPGDVLIYGRWGRVFDRAFLTAGTLLILLGAAMAMFGP
jgi:hypothetical protein